MSPAIAIDVRGVTKVFGDGANAVRALDNVSVQFREGEFFTLLGPSGCGKTTLLRLLAGFEQPTEGAIRLHGQNLAGLPPFRRPVNTVFQSYALFPHMTVAGNVGFGLEMQSWPKAKIAERVDEVLSLVKLGGYQNRKPAQLSGGQQQRVALARALANQPKVLLLDEPLSALDLKLRKEMQIELKRLQSETGITFVFVTHDQEEALTMSDRLAVMDCGRILQVGAPRDIYEHPENRFVADFIGETNLIVARVMALEGETGVFRLPSGAKIRGKARDGLMEGAEVTLALRPERTVLADGDSALLAGEVENVVYFGTDTLYQVAINGVGLFQVRSQNVNGGVADAEIGARVGISFAPGAIQVLRD